MGLRIYFLCGNIESTISPQTLICILIKICKDDNCFQGDIKNEQTKNRWRGFNDFWNNRIALCKNISLFHNIFQGKHLENRTYIYGDFVCTFGCF